MQRLEGVKTIERITDDHIRITMDDGSILTPKIKKNASGTHFEYRLWPSQAFFYNKNNVDLKKEK